MKWILLVCLLLPVAGFSASDLEILDLKAAADEQGKTVAIQVQWQNLGPQDAANPSLNLYFSSNHHWTLAGTQALDLLASGGSRTDQLTVAMPAGGMTAIRAEIFDSEQPDVHPGTNMKEAAIQFGGTRTADLEIVSAQIDSQQPVDARFVSATVHLRNRGPEDVTSTKLVVDLLLFNQSVVNLERRLGKLLAGEEKDFNFTIRLPAQIPASVGALTVKFIQQDLAIQDSVPVNNNATLSVALVPKMPDLVPLDVKVDKLGRLWFTTTNKGKAPSTECLTALFINGSLIKRYQVPALGPGATKQHLYGGAKVSPGTQVTIVADYNADVPETSEDNNRFQLTTE